MAGEEKQTPLMITASRLATAELVARLDAADNESERRQLLRQVNELRAADPERAEKKYWWDVPFTSGAPKESEEGTFYMEDGFYMEGDDLFFQTLSGSGKMFSKEKDGDVKRLLDDYTVFSDTYILLYVNKKQMRKYVKERLRVRTIYHCEWDDVSYRRKNPLSGDAAYVDFLRRSYENNVGQINARMQENLIERDRRIDKREMLFNYMEHNAVMTSQEAYFHGRMSQQEYFSDSIWRDYELSEIRHKAFQEKERRRMEYDRKMQEYKRILNQSGTYTTVQEARLHMMAVGQAVYRQDELLALVAYKSAEPVYEIRCASDFDLESLTGRIFNYRILFDKKAAKIPLIQHIIENYGDAMPLYMPLDPRPRNCPDAEWRMWAEARWAQTLNVLRAIQ